MNEDERAALEGELCRIAGNFPRVKEIWYNPMHFMPDGKEVKEDCYAFVNGGLDFALEEAFAAIETGLSNGGGVNVSFLQMNVRPDRFERRVYFREA